MNKERLPEAAVVKEKDPRRERAYLFISGGLGSDHGLAGINRALHDVTKSKHIKMFNSIISMDKPNPQRHEQQAQFIKDNLDAGREVEVITHSLGSLESTRALAIILAQDPMYFDDPEKASKLTLNYTASSGFDRGVIHETKFLAKYVALGGSVNRAVNAATAFPPQNMTSEELADGMRMIFGKKKPKDIVMEPFNPQDPNYEKLPDAVKEKLIVDDATLKEHMEKKRKWKARRVLKKRGKFVSPHLEKVFEGEYEPNNKIPAAPPVDFVHFAKQPEIRSALKDMLSKNIYEMSSDLIEKGVNLKVVAFEHDRAITRRSINHFIKHTASDSKRGEVTMVELFGHSGIVLQAHNYIDAVTNRDVTDLANVRKEKEEQRTKVWNRMSYQKAA